MSARRRRRRSKQRLFLLLLLVIIAVFVWNRYHGASTSDQIGEASETQSQVTDGAPMTPPLSFAGFDAGNIISDQVFYNSSAMDMAQVADFIAQAGRGCRPGKSLDGTVPCLTDYVEDSPSFPADDYCFAFDGAAEDSAASIVTKAARSCGINPQVLLVMLQKEQGLLTAFGSGLTPERYTIAMGYGCPDTANCDPQFFGFANQVYHAARQLRLYANEPWKFAFQPEAENTVAFSPDPDCGASTVWIENYATAGLYNYTPYQPNQAALSGSPDACSAVGNLYFYAYFHAYFD